MLLAERDGLALLLRDNWLLLDNPGAPRSTEKRSAGAAPLLAEELWGEARGDFAKLMRKSYSNVRELEAVYDEIKRKLTRASLGFYGPGRGYGMNGAILFKRLGLVFVPGRRDNVVERKKGT